MPVVRQAAGKLSLDMGPAAGEHLWVAKDCTLQDGGYEKLPEWAEVQAQGVGSGLQHRGAHCWRGGYTGRVYAASDNKFWEVADSSVTDVTGSTVPTNATNGVKFASYGEWCFAANGVDKIQYIKVPSALAGTGNFGDMTYTTGGAKIAPKYICSHKNHIIAANIKFVESYGQIASYTTGAITIFSNQPNGSGSLLQVISSDVADTGQSVTIYGTLVGGGDTVGSETIVTNGTTAVDGAVATFQRILGVIITSGAAATGTITVRNKTGTTTIAQIAPAGTSSGVYTVAAASSSGGDRVLDLVASAATTNNVGIIGTDPSSAVLFDSQALSGTTTVQSNYDFRSVSYILVGDVGTGITVTVKSHQYPAGYTDPYLVWWSGTDDPEGYGTEVLAPQIVGSSNQPLLDGVGQITGVVDGGDCFFVFKDGCIYRFDGPPFQPTVISYSNGMTAGLLPYRQGDRIYFWSNSGLNYINVLDNSVVPTMGGYVQRAVRDHAAANYGLSTGAFPESRVAIASLKNATATEDAAAICGDPENGLVLVFYRNASSPGTNGLVYHEKQDAFTQVYKSAFNSIVPNLVDYRIGTGQIPGVFAYIRSWGWKANTVLAFNKLSNVGLPPSGTDDVYLRWPFLGSQPGGPTTRIARVRPIFDNPTYTATQSISIHCLVLSMNGTGKNWVLHGVPSVGQGTTSLDGWITVDGCPFAERHSVGISFLGGAGAAAPNPSISKLIGVDVDVVAGSRKGI